MLEGVDVMGSWLVSGVRLDLFAVVSSRPTVARGGSCAFRSVCYSYRGNICWQLEGLAVKAVAVIFS